MTCGRIAGKKAELILTRHGRGCAHGTSAARRAGTAEREEKGVGAQSLPQRRARSSCHGNMTRSGSVSVCNLYEQLLQTGNVRVPVPSVWQPRNCQHAAGVRANCDHRRTPSSAGMLPYMDDGRGHVRVACTAGDAVHAPTACTRYGYVQSHTILGVKVPDRYWHATHAQHVEHSWALLLTQKERVLLLQQEEGTYLARGPSCCLVARHRVCFISLVAFSGTSPPLQTRPTQTREAIPIRVMRTHHTPTAHASGVAGRSSGGGKPAPSIPSRGFRRRARFCL